MSALDDVKQQIIADLETKQGPWRRRPRGLRLALVVLPALVLFGAAFALMRPDRGVDGAVVAALVAAALALAGVALAPDTPAVSERFAQAATGVGGAAFAIELVQMSPIGPGAGIMGCLPVVVVLALLAAVVLTLALRASALPLRLWHRVGLGTAAALGASASAWHHCASHEMIHVLVAHAAAPVVVLVAVVVAVRRLS